MRRRYALTAHLCGHNKTTVLGKLGGKQFFKAKIPNRSGGLGMLNGHADQTSRGIEVHKDIFTDLFGFSHRVASKLD